MAIASGDAGFIIQADDGKKVFFPFGVCDDNPCTPDPEILCTVTGASGTINWCGETWNLPADSGVEKSVCPTTYITNQAAQVASNRWEYTNDLNLKRKWYITSSASTEELNFLQLTYSLKDQHFRRRASTAASWNTTSFYQDLNIIFGEAFPTYSDYLITDGYFGTHTAAGITYTWARGAGW